VKPLDNRWRDSKEQNLLFEAQAALGPNASPGQLARYAADLRLRRAGATMRSRSKRQESDNQEKAACLFPSLAGTSSYTKGCRCSRCRSARADYTRLRRAAA
jgi:hypothetical protein